MDARLALPPLLLALLAACGDVEPRWERRTAAQWLDVLEKASPEEGKKAFDALVRFGAERPEAVASALAARFSRDAPMPDAWRITLVPDRFPADAPPPQPSEVDGVIAVLRRRLTALGTTSGLLEPREAGRVDVTLGAGRPREEAEAVQAVLGRRGALDLRVVVPDPAAPPPHALRGRVYQGTVPFAALRAAEAERWLAAKADGKPYVPSEARVRVAPRAGTAPSGPADFEVLEEPEEAKDVLDEGAFRDARGARTAAGEPALEADVREDRAADVRRFCSRNTGLDMAVVLDGWVVAKAPVPATVDGRTLAVPLGPPPPDHDARAWARETAALAVGGRLPWPMRPDAGSPRRQAALAAENVYSHLAVALGPRAIPALEKVAQTGAPWGKESAAWALRRLRGP